MLRACKFTIEENKETLPHKWIDGGKRDTRDLVLSTNAYRCVNA
jgi:hypothetical protein